MLDFRIETFVEVCRHLSYTKAAEVLNITQPAVSQHIKYLEGLYQTKLLHYEGKKVYLTTAGERLFRAATTMIHDNNRLKKLLLDDKGLDTKLIFGATLTIGEFVMGQPISAYLGLYPDAQVRMVIGNTSELILKLKLGEIDFALVEGNYDKSDFDALLFSSERYIPVCGQGYPFEKPPKSIQDLLSERIVLREKGSGTREILERYLEYRNLVVGDFRHRVEIGGINAIKALVENNCGITFVYEPAVREELILGKLVEIKLSDFEVSHDFSFIWNKGSHFEGRFRDIFNWMKDNRRQ